MELTNLLIESSGKSPRTLLIIKKNSFRCSFVAMLGSLPTFSNNLKFSEDMKLLINSSGASPSRLFTILKKVTNSSFDASNSKTASTNSLKSMVPELSLSAWLKNLF